MALSGVLVLEVQEMVAPQLAARNLTFDSRVPDDVVLCVDREKAVQILLNLLSNALKFTAPGGRIEVRSRPGNRPGSVTIDVADTGRGIPADRIDAVFDPFVQVRSEPSKANEGTGLGLAISRNLARGMGGDLSAVSEPGKGSTFSLTLPVAP